MAGVNPFAGEPTLAGFGASTPTGSGPVDPTLGMGSMAPQMPTPTTPATVAAPSLDMLGGLGGNEPAPEPAIKKLRPGTELHDRVRNKLDAMLHFSRDRMKSHYHRWNVNEQKIQAYTNLNDFEALADGMRQKNATPPQPFQVVVPYSYATIHAAATFVATVLLGRKPVFPLLATRGTQMERSRYLEAALQSNLDASRGYETLWQSIWDSFVYGFGPTRITWEERTGKLIRWVGGQRELGTGLKFAGNVVGAIDPYKFYPDPRVPIHQCNVKGDFMFTEVPISETVLKDMGRSQMLMFVDEAILSTKNRGNVVEANESNRRIRLGSGVNVADLRPTNVVGFQAMMEGTARIVPKDWGLGDSADSEIWKFSWFERGQIMQAEPLNMIHDQHPYIAPEPTTFGHDFMSLSMQDMIGNFQEILSWLVSSRMENVRSAVQNSFAVDPSRIDINDIRSSAIGRMIRLKQTAMGQPVKEALMQIQVQDVTMGHMADMQNMRILADTITGVNDNMRGIQTAGGRRSATEARIAMQNGGGRLSQHAVRISAQGYHPMVEQMISNIQQFMPDEMWLEVTGDDGQVNSMAMTPDMLVGSFNYQISDGTLPFDKQALTEVWKEILIGVAQDPELRARFDIGEIFRHVAELGGAKNIDSFQKQQQPIQTGAVADPSADPNLVPMGPAMPTAPLMASGFQG